ncbi:putative T-complex 11 protein [Helianthus anomalus]
MELFVFVCHMYGMVYVYRRKTPARTRQIKKAGPASSCQGYQVRVVLCVYMILGHLDAVFSGQGEHETVLAESVKKFVHEFIVDRYNSAEIQNLNPLASYTLSIFIFLPYPNTKFDLGCFRLLQRHG